jgi:hypothetical protein
MLRCSGSLGPTTPSVSNSCVHVPASGGSAQIWAKAVSLDRPFPASSQNRCSQMPRRAQRTDRL